MNNSTIIGRQTFDGLGRQLSVSVGGHTSRFQYRVGQLPPSSTRLADGKEVRFTYEKDLNNQLLKVEADGEAPTEITRHAQFGHPSTIAGELGSQAFAFSPGGQATKDGWTVDGQTHTTAWRYSFSGLLQGFHDAKGIAHRRQFDSSGRVSATRVGEVDTAYTYDALSRPATVSVSVPESGRVLTTAITYDAVGREHTRTFTITQTGEEEKTDVRTITQTLAYTGLDQIASRTWAEGAACSEERFEYDVRDRLVRYLADEHAAAPDPYGNLIVEQVFTFNAYNGHEKVVSTYADGSCDEARFTYAVDDPTRPVKVTHTHPAWPAEVTLGYDARGRVINDSLGRHLHWNAQGRLTEVRSPSGTCKYRYDPSGQLTDREVDGVLTRDFYSADQLTHQYCGKDSIELISDLSALFAVNKVTGGIRQTLLLGTDAQGSLRIEAGSTVRTRRYTAHGAQASDVGDLAFGYTGEQLEPLSGLCIPGGNRPYDPILMCFLAPDTDSPFGPGGINPYAWCGGDPVNRVDPDGHSWVNYAIAGAGLALGLVAMIPAVIAALPVAGALISSGAALLTTGQIAGLVGVALDIVGMATGVASLALEATGADGAASGILGGVSMVASLAGAGIGLKLFTLKNAGSRLKAMDIKQGWTLPKPGRLGSGELLAQHTSRGVDVGFIDTYLGSNRAALLTHGDLKRALLMGPDGKTMRAADVARDVIAPRLQALGTGADDTFVLLSCWGGKNGAALEIARELGRPVQGFTGKVFVKGFANLQLNPNAANIPTQATSYLERMRATGNPFKALKTTYKAAKSNIYHPDGTVVAV
ncbi:RHS repeat domain-containing protein [Pseudomonas graminis]|uniref:RHS repeat-associated core domain-containing protein n=1 Tax=Pseudomonas graminis TaxID=158627 RepID=A0A1H9ZKJ4_9PSED|nr:RHS repeat-associated core domain-containing protein [Pseudomonas graminis]SES82248.1 RHS repeat-associated core domain-containing protein [Pseudomonas graminis]